MPLYTFKCNCGYEFDKLASYADVIIVCPQCKETATRVSFYRDAVIRGDPAEIPSHETDYIKEDMKKDLNRSGWDYSRALEHVNSHTQETEHGKVLNLGG